MDPSHHKRHGKDESSSSSSPSALSSSDASSSSSSSSSPSPGTSSSLPLIPPHFRPSSTLNASPSSPLLSSPSSAELWLFQFPLYFPTDDFSSLSLSPSSPLTFPPFEPALAEERFLHSFTLNGESFALFECPPRDLAGGLVPFIPAGKASSKPHRLVAAKPFERMFRVIKVLDEGAGRAPKSALSRANLITRERVSQLESIIQPFKPIGYGTVMASDKDKEKEGKEGKRDKRKGQETFNKVCYNEEEELRALKKLKASKEEKKVEKKGDKGEKREKENEKEKEKDKEKDKNEKKKDKKREKSRE